MLSNTMATSRLGFSLGLVLLSVVFWGSANGCTVTIRNNCGFSVTACAQSSADPISQFTLPAGGSQVIDLPTCSWPAAAVYASVTGQCAVAGNPSASTDRNLANLAEFTIGGNDNQDAYDISNVNAYTIGLAIRPTDASCKAPSCTIADIGGFCQPNNVLQTQSSGAQSCINTDGTAGLGPTSGTVMFKNACQDAYSYNFDDPTSLFFCVTGTSYDVVFCP